MYLLKPYYFYNMKHFFSLIPLLYTIVNAYTVKYMYIAYRLRALIYWNKNLTHIENEALLSKRQKFVTRKNVKIPTTKRTKNFMGRLFREKSAFCSCIWYSGRNVSFSLSVKDGWRNILRKSDSAKTFLSRCERASLMIVLATAH